MRKWIRSTMLCWKLFLFLFLQSFVYCSERLKFCFGSNFTFWWHDTWQTLPTLLSNKRIRTSQQEDTRWTQFTLNIHIEFLYMTELNVNIKVFNLQYVIKTCNTVILILQIQFHICRLIGAALRIHNHFV